MATTLAALLKGPQSTAGREDKSLYFDQTSSFAQLGLDRRLFKAVAKAGYIYPSIVQTSTIPLVLEGRDVLVRARTGTGKTAAYLLPVLHQLLDVASSGATPTQSSGGVRAIVLVPTRDLCDQVRDSVRTFSNYARDVITCVTLNADSKKALTLEASQLKTNPNIVVATPGRLLQHLAAGTLAVKHSLKTLVVDEADLVLSYGYEDDVKALNAHFPEFFQCVLMSATLTPELDALKALLLHNPAVVKLDESGATNTAAGSLSQYFLLCPKNDKLLLLYVHAALGLYKGKTLFFVNTVAEAFHLKLFLEQFSINAAVLNDDLPYNSRRNIVLQFNRGVFDYLIATDMSSDEVDVEDEARLEGAVRMQVFSETGSGRKGVDLNARSDDDDDDDADASDDSKDEADVKAEAVSSSDDDDSGDDDVESGSDSGSDDDSKKGKKVAVTVKPEPKSDDEGSASGSDSDAEEIEPKGKKARAAAATKKEEKKEKKEKQEGNALAPSGGLQPSGGLTPSSQLPTQRAGETEDAFLTRLETAESARRARAGAASSDRTGVARGIDFIDVQTVVNVDFPLTYKSYTHRVGRTARAGKAGQAISYVSKDEQALLEAVMEGQSVTEAGGVVATKEPELRPLPFSLESANSFRYRVDECRRKITTTAVKEARLAAIRAEMLNSERLRAHFEDNPHELSLLKHNKALSNRKKVDRHLNFVPSYLIPAEFRALGIDGGKVELGAHGGGLSSRSGRRHRMKINRKRGKEMDPLQSFAYNSEIDDGQKGFKAKERDEFAKRGGRKPSTKGNRHRR
jgi:ATP-dependent RNA helicase DDX56/DBP9